MKRSPIASVLLTRGTATEMARVFDAGRVVSPFSVGSCGDWCVAADGVEAHHLYLCFDGRALFAASTEGGPVSSVGGKRLVAHWTRLPDGCVLTFGGAAFAVSSLGERMKGPPPLPARRADSRGPRVLDPFACETLAYARFSPPPGARREPFDEPTVVRPAIDAPQAIGVSCEPLDDPTIVYRPWAREFALEALVRADPVLERTIARPLSAPVAASRAAARVSTAPAARTPILRKFMAGLIVATLVLMGVRALTRRPRIVPAKAVAAAISASSRAVTAASESPNARAAPTDGKPRNAQLEPLLIVKAMSAERPAVAGVTRGAYAEVAAVCDRLARWCVVPGLREAVRIARSQARAWR